MEFKNRDFAPSCNDAGDADLGKESKSDRFDAISGGLVAVDVQSLSSRVASVEEKSSTVGALAPILTLARKGSHRGGERKASEISATAVSAASTGSFTGFVSNGENSDVVVIHVAREGDSTAIPHATTPTAGATVGGGRCRRAAYRRPSRWLNPRRVLVFFATLSSMGTLVLLYFTLSMAKVAGGDANAR